VTTSLVVLLGVIIGAGYVAWRWTQDQYYVGADKGEVVIYRGVNQRIAGISLSKPYQQTGIVLAQVPSPYQQAVKDTDAASSLNDARSIVGNVRTAVGSCKQQYDTLATWVTAESAYQAAQAIKHKKPATGIRNPGPKPQIAASCPPSEAFDIAASAIAPPNPGHS